MSGGVDSSVAAALLLEQGYEVLGVTMQLWDYSKNENVCDPNAEFDTCCSHDDVADARMVAHKLGIPFYVLNYEEEFKKDVVDYFTSEYIAGKTPNPCVACNTFLKFDLLLERARSLGCDFIATGHYARVQKDEEGLFHLLKGVDPTKDQSYFLYSFTQERLSKTLFPLGGLLKQDVRKLAEKYGLVNAHKKDSMEICFIPGNNYQKFVEENANKADIVTGKIIYEKTKEILAEHDGIHKFTVGQRKGLGFSFTSPLYVTRIEPETGDVFVGEDDYLYSEVAKVSHLSFIHKKSLDKNVQLKIRYRSPAAEAYVENFEDSAAIFRFSKAQRAITPGQIAVFYQNDEVLGGGTIERN